MMTTVAPCFLSCDDAIGERLVAFGVEVGARLVEHDEARTAEHGARERDPLAIAAGEDRAALADLGVVAVGEAENHVVHAGKPRRLHDLGVVVHLEPADIGGDRIGEELDVLRQVAENAAKRFARPQRDVGAVEADGARHSAAARRRGGARASICRRRTAR